MITSKSFLKLLLGALLLISIGCASGNQYSSTYNSAVANGKSDIFYTAVPFDEFLKTFTDVLKSAGYERVIYTSSDGSFLAVVKNPSLVKSLLLGDANSHKILIKFTKWDDGKTRVDMVNGTTYVIAKDEVDHDIQSIIQKLR